MGPFIKYNRPILEPSSDSFFNCPITKSIIKWEQENVMNPSAVVKDGKIFLIYRGDELGRMQSDDYFLHTCRLGIAYSADGINFTRHGKPVVYPDHDISFKYEWQGGCEDLHIIQGEDGKFYMNYTTFTGKFNSQSVDSMCIAVSNNLYNWEKHGSGFEKSYNGRFVWGRREGVPSRSGVVVSKLIDGNMIPAKIDNKYWMYYSLQSWLAYSDDLINWTPILDKDKKPVMVLKTREGMFDSSACEAGAAALLTDDGIILFYNALNAHENGDSDIPSGAWTLGQALINPKDMMTVVDRLDKPFIYPEYSWEKKGLYPNTTVCNALVWFQGKWIIYYGAADHTIGMAEFQP